MTLLDEQFLYRGLTFGPGTPYMLNSFDGIEGFQMRVSDSDQPRGDGAIRGLDYASAKTISFGFQLIETVDNGGTDYEGMWQQIRRTFAPSRSTDDDLVFKRPGQPERLIRCRPIQLIRTEKFTSFNRMGSPPVVLRAVDPRIYSSAVRSGNALVYAVTGGGVDYPLDYPVDFSGGTQMEFVAQNDGTADAYPLIRFYHPVATGTVNGVKLTNTTTGQILTINSVVSSGQILTADMGAMVNGSDGLVISLDGASRYGGWALPREPFALAPGSNTLRFEVIGTATDAICNLTWRDTWMD